MDKKKKIKSSIKTELPLNEIICGHNIREMRKFSENSIDSILTDPPYGLGFMGKEWDTFKDAVHTYKKGYYTTRTPEGRIIKHYNEGSSAAFAAGSYDFSRNAEFQKWFTKWAKECLRVAKPGAFMLVFGGTRTFHRLTCAIEDAGWQIRDCLMWLYGSGFPKSLDISKAIDKVKGKERNRIKVQEAAKNSPDYGKYSGEIDDNNPITKLAKLWNGYGTALKPAWEPIIVAMKPVDGTFAKNAEKYGVAGLNIDGGRIGTEERYNQKAGNPTDRSTNSFGAIPNPSNYQGQECQGRWPANVILDGESAKILDRQEDASRFFYIAKSSRSERDAGLIGIEGKSVHEITGRKQGSAGQMSPYAGITGNRVIKNIHPTVKPLQLMQYLCQLLKMPNKDQVILDPFAGSGTTCVACKGLGINYIGIDNNEDYCIIARKRLKNVKPNLFEKPKKKKAKKKESFGL